MSNEQLCKIAKELRKNVALLSATDGTSEWFRAETVGEILKQVITLARREVLSQKVGEAAVEIGFTMATSDADSATGSDADMRTLAKNARAFSKALCAEAVGNKRG